MCGSTHVGMVRGGWDGGWGLGEEGGGVEPRALLLVLSDRWRDVKNKAFFHAKHRTYVDLKVSLMQPPQHSSDQQFGGDLSGRG